MCGLDAGSSPGARWRRGARLAAAAGCLLAAGQGCATIARSAPIRAEPWRELSTEHFVLATELPAGEAEHVIRELEEYLSALVAVVFTGLPAPQQTIPVVTFATGDELQRYLHSIWEGVYFDNVLGGPLIVAGGPPERFYDASARHELAHYVADLAYRRPLPRWFSEGSASMLETISYDRERHMVLLGRAAWGRVAVLEKQGPLPVRDVLAGEVDEKNEMQVERYYATSWLLVHCLMSRHPSSLDDYQRFLSSGVPAEQAWARSLPAATRDHLDAELAGYLATHGYQQSWGRPWLAPEIKVVSRTPSPADVLATMALVHLAAGTTWLAPPPDWRKEASDLVARALAADPSHRRALQIQRVLQADGASGRK